MSKGCHQITLTPENYKALKAIAKNDWVKPSIAKLANALLREAVKKVNK
jgi:hypothetical protein